MGIGLALLTLAACLRVGGVPARASQAVPLVPPQAALFEGLAAQAAPDDPFRALANPAGPALLEGGRWGSAFTVRDGTVDDAASFVHTIGWAEGSRGEGWALWASHGGRDALPGSPSPSVTELGIGYGYAMSMGPDWALGVAGHYRRVRGERSGSGEPREDHYLGVDIGLVSALADRVAASARLDSLLEVRQSGAGGPAEQGAQARPPALGVGIAYQANAYLVLEANALDLLDVSTGRTVRLETRLYPAAPVALRLGYESSSRGDGFLLGAGVEEPGKRWAVSYAFLGGPAYGGIHQVGLIAALP
ncbi:hypothetical protein [Geochorda subterranea]|uniref:Uncharacterized protein n=1 Tax=Geochorda subterranea TaxID=3109564 RepID=A0ABZ1BQY4_9FIRM|nr:hypothetical protein [Limnochorda sp. LNt]WRP14851.1 hypothetical protein VLY81_01380 [Limnochorda sp. LNt]